jgi:Uma2 family endonuclease
MSRIAKPVLPPLVDGEKLDQPTFHARYEAMPDRVKAELIDGVVVMAAALKHPHGRSHGKLIHWLHEYEDATPGVEAFDNTTMIMGPRSEPQPDAALIIRPGLGGQMQLSTDGYLVGSPELTAEVADSTEAFDLHIRKRDYEQASVQEYLVVALRRQKVFWFRREGEQFVELTPCEDGILRSQVFPGLWLDPQALLALDGKRLLAVLHDGVSTAQHQAFVDSLVRPAG